MPPNSTTTSTIFPSPDSANTAPGAPSWRSIFRWYWPTSPEQSVQSERTILEAWGNIPLSSDPQHARLQAVHLPMDGEAVERTTNPRFINTLILDQEDVTADASTRLNLVLCHGFGTGLGFFYRNLLPLSRAIPGVRIYAFDWLGMGRSGRPPFPKFQLAAAPSNAAAIDFFLDSFEEWRQRQPGLERFVMLGHSMGGYLSALYALRHPKRVQKLILASPVGLPQQGETETGIAVTGHRLPVWFSNLWNANYTPQGLIRAIGPIGPRFAMGYVSKRFQLAEEETRDLSNYLYHISADIGSGEYALAALLAPGAWAREPLHHRLAQIAMPTTFLYGDSDWMDRRHAQQAASQMSVPVKIISVPRAGHNLYLDNHGEFNRIIIEEMLSCL